MYRKNQLMIQIISLPLLILLPCILQPKGPSFCVSTSAIFQSNYDQLDIYSFKGERGITVTGDLQLSWKDLGKGIYPFGKIAYCFPSCDEIGSLSVSYQTLFLNGGIGKHFKIENSNLDFLISIGKRWQDYDIRFGPDSVTFSLNSVCISAGTRIRSPLYKRTFTAIAYNYYYSKNQHISGVMPLGTRYDLQTYGNLHLWSIGLGMEF